MCIWDILSLYHIHIGIFIICCMYMHILVVGYTFWHWKYYICTYKRFRLFRSVFTRADESHESRGSKAFICICLRVCVSVCPHNRTKTAETTIAKLATQIVHHESYPFDIRSKGHRSRPQGHKVLKLFQVMEWLTWVCTSIECPSSSCVSCV